MATNYQLDPVVRRIDASQRREASNDGIVVEVPVGSGWFSEKRLYFVARPGDRTGRTTFTLDREVVAPEKDWRITLQISLTVQLAGDDLTTAKRLVDIVHGAANPDRGLEQRVNVWIDDFIRTRWLNSADFIQQMPAHQTELKSDIVRRALEESGLQVSRIDIGIHGASDGVLEIRVPHLLVVLRDYQPELPLGLDVDLSVDSSSILAYLPSGQRDRVEREIRQRVRDFCRTQVTLHTWQFAADTTLRQSVEREIDTVAREVGRRVERLVMRAAPPITGVPSFLDVSLAKEPFRRLDYPDPLEIDVTMRVDLKDLGTFVSHGMVPAELAQWLQRQARDAVLTRLLDVPYPDLFDLYDEKQAAVQVEVARRAERIGYSLTRFELQTNLDFDVIRRGFHCHLEKVDFPLVLRECVVTLDVETRFKISRDETMRRLFKNDPRIRQTIEDRIRRAIAEELRRTTPEEFYLHFGDSTPGAQSVEAALQRRVREACMEFDPEPDFPIAFAVRPDPLLEAIRTLVKTPIVLERVKEPNTGIEVNVEVEVRRIYNDHFQQFQIKSPTSEVVAATVRNHVVSYLAELARLNVNALLTAPLDQVEQHLEQWINGRLAPHLGVGINVVHLQRHDRIVGKPMERIDVAISEFEGTLQELLQQQRRLIVQGDDEGADEVASRISRLKRELDQLYKERGTGSVLSPADPTFRLPEARAPRQIAEAVEAQEDQEE